MRLLVINMAYIPVASGVAKLLKSWDLQPHGIFADGGGGGSVPTEEKKKVGILGN